MITVKKKDNVITISGHAGYEKKGEDIVCASVSSIMYTTLNAILRFSNDAISYEDDKKKVTIVNKKGDNITNTLLSNMMSLFLELAMQYPKNIKIESEE